MAGPLDFLLGTGPDAAAKAAALEQLMKQRQLGLLNQFSGDKVLAPIGRQMVQDVGSQQEAQALAQHQQAQMAQQAAQQQAVLGRQTAQDAALEKFRNAQLGNERTRLGLERARLNKPPAPPKPPSSDDLRKEFQGQQGYKDFQQVSAAYKKIQTTSDTGPGDMSLIFGYMKLLDPNSTVREGEYATAAQAGSVPQTVLATYNRALKGEKLAPEVRKQFRDEAAKVYGAQKSQFDQVAAPYVDYATKQGLAPGDVIFGYQPPTDEPKGGKVQTAGQGQASAADQQAKAWAEANPTDPRAAKIMERLKAKGL